MSLKNPFFQIFLFRLLFTLLILKIKKKKFRESTKNYKLSEDNKTLLYKTKAKIYNKINLKYELIYEYHKVSKIKELNEKLLEYYCNNFHCNERGLISIFKENKINFYELQTIIQVKLYIDRNNYIL